MKRSQLIGFTAAFTAAAFEVAVRAQMQGCSGEASCGAFLSASQLEPPVL
jgi:hypothetical protein